MEKYKINIFFNLTMKEKEEKKSREQESREKCLKKKKAEDKNA